MTTASDQEVLEWIGAMRADVEAGPEIYRPGAFWDALIAENMRMISADGIEKFKRTVSNNYFNWLVTSVRDPQLQHAILRWARRPSLAALTTSVEDASGLRTTDRDHAVSLDRRSTFLYGFFVGSLWELAVREDSRDLTSRLSEPSAGSPVRIAYRDKPISQDLANSIIEFSFADRAGVVTPGARVAELGAGYGRLAHVYAEAGAAYCIFDIPPALAVSQWYLGEILGAERVLPYRADMTFEEASQELRPGMVAFFTPAQLEVFPDGFFDLTQTISTLPEMPAEQAAHFQSLLLAKSSSAFFLKQWKSWRNEVDDVHLTEASYTPPTGWTVVARRQDPVQPAFFDQLWRREAAA